MKYEEMDQSDKEYVCECLDMHALKCEEVL